MVWRRALAALCLHRPPHLPRPHFLAIVCPHRHLHLGVRGWEGTGA
jgi:hypothetical protein